MSDFPWIMWIASTVAIEGALLWYVKRSERRELVEHHRWPLKSESILARKENPDRFDRIVAGWKRMLLVVPLITFGLLYLGAY